MKSAYMDHASATLKTSPVLVAIGIPPNLAQGAVVFTMNSHKRFEEIEHVLEKVCLAVEKLRSLSPNWGRKVAP